MTHDDEQRQLTAAREDLVLEFADRLDGAAVTARFEQVVAGFEGAPIRTFVPVIARRVARQELAAQA